ncbi:MAG: hypothetical protein PHN88_02765 [Ignavibacteria bacterium]|nr:hypothetical protein [Ignavibacteria bacterium]
MNWFKKNKNKLEINENDGNLILTSDNKMSKEELNEWKEKLEKGFIYTPASEYIPDILDNSGKLVEIQKDKYDGFARLCQDLLK